MPKPIPSPPPGFDKLTVDERIDFVQSLWDHIAATSEQVPVPDRHRRIIRERLESYRTDPSLVVHGRTFAQKSKPSYKIVDLTEDTATCRPTAV